MCIRDSLENPKLTSSSGAVLTVEKDLSVRVVGDPAESDTYTIEAKTELKRVRAIRLKALSDKTLPAKGPGRAADGRFVLSSLAVGISDSADGKFNGLPLNNARDLDRPDDATVGRSLVGNSADGWNPPPGKSSTAVFEVASAVSKTDWMGNPLPGGVQDGATQVFTVYAGSPAPSAGTIDRLRYLSLIHI